MKYSDGAGISEEIWNDFKQIYKEANEWQSNVHCNVRVGALGKLKVVWNNVTHQQSETTETGFCCSNCCNDGFPDSLGTKEK
jgi:hypothetical protein